MEQKELSFIADRNANQHSHLEDSLAVPTKLNKLLPFNPVIIIFDIYPRIWNLCPHKILYADICSSFLKIIAKTWKQPNCPSTNSASIQTIKYYPTILKRISYQVSETQGGNVSAYYWEARLKRLQAVLFKEYSTMKKAKHKILKRLVIIGVEGRSGEDEWSTGIFKVVKLVYIISWWCIPDILYFLKLHNPKSES